MKNLSDSQSNNRGAGQCKSNERSSGPTFAPGKPAREEQRRRLGNERHAGAELAAQQIAGRRLAAARPASRIEYGVSRTVDIEKD